MTPQIERERFEHAEDGRHRQVERMENARPVIVENYDPPAGLDDAERFRERATPDFFGLFMQQEEEQSLIVSSAVDCRAAPLPQIKVAAPESDSLRARLCN